MEMWSSGSGRGLVLQGGLMLCCYLACPQVRMAVERGRATRPDIGLGICGEHGGDPTSIAFFDKVRRRGRGKGRGGGGGGGEGYAEGPDLPSHSLTRCGETKI